ncbi:MAG: hypothetical protein MRY78_01920, partial [Saprospiraceae bacterium]|nr:hypothetical protein [Saprospiraceae bacterium]
MRSLFALLVLLLISLYIRAQENLVLNPGFEEYDDCPNDGGQFAFTVSEWTTYFANPEYMNCDYQRFETEFPRTGNGYAGAYLYFPTATPNYYFREYLHGRLSDALEKDSVYYAEFYVRPFELSGFIDRIELAFSQSPLDSLMPTNGVLDVTPSVAYQDGILFETDDYVKVSG